MAVGVSVGAHAVIGDGVVLSTAVTVGSGCSIGAGVSIGERSVLHPNVTLYPHVIIGARCILHAGVVIGADGFGYVPVGVELMRVPHLGSVRIEDDVEVGANTCVDRAKTGETVIGKGTKLDNLIHVAHNVHIGRSCLIIAQVGIAGSVTIGDGVILAGQAGIADHIDIGSGAKVAAQGGVIGDVPAGVTVSGYPARPHATKMREHAASASLPDYIKRVRALEKRLAQLEAALGQADRSST
jgi:UDP-3-O-[3-hydroxymyristoyl] glucosamine N-acyltransferase